MKPFAYCLAALAISAPALVYAQSVTDADAKAIEQKLAYFVPDGMAKAGIFRVRPSGDHYDLTIDPAAFFTGMDSRIRATEVQPLVLKLSQGTDGLWTVSGAGRPKMIADFTTPAGEKGHLAIESAVTANIVFDPSLGFPRSVSLILDKPSWKTNLENATFSVGADQLALKSDLANLRSGVADLAVGFSSKGLKAETGPRPVSLSAANFDAKWRIGSANITGALKLADFLFQKQKQGFYTLTASEKADFRKIVRAEPPLLQTLSQDYSVGDLHVTRSGESSLAAMKLSIEVANDSDVTKLHLSAEKPVMPVQSLPYGADLLLPQQLSTDLKIQGIRWDDGLSYSFENADDRTPEGAAKLRKTLIPDDRVTFTFDNGIARSPQYDVTFKGSLAGSGTPHNVRPSADLALTMRDIDKTANVLQSNANVVPIFRQLSVWLLAAKGFGAQEADGITRWDIKITEGGKLTVNGQEIRR